MAITFGLRRKKEKKLILIAVVVLIIGGIIGGVILIQRRAPQALLGIEVFKPKAPKINWEVLDDPRIEKLQSLIQIPPLTEKPGRENPFLPY